MPKIISPSAELLWITSNSEQTIERAGRICYKSENKITEESAKEFIKNLIEKGHEAMLEHASASILFVCDRGVSHELVRHRIASYAQESTRYCNYSKDKFGEEITVIKPLNLENRQEVYWYASMQESENAYLQLLDAGCTAQIARSVLPNSLKTEIICTANMREWRKIFSLRLAKSAHPQMREVMTLAYNILVKESEVMFQEFKNYIIQ